MVASLQNSDGVEAHLRAQLVNLAEQVAVLTAAQVSIQAGSCRPFSDHL